MTGATSTPTGTPASLSVADRLQAPLAARRARGSSVRASSRSSVVIDT